jgi:uncharacterized membrane protein (DUF485 family)
LPDLNYRIYNAGEARGDNDTDFKKEPALSVNQWERAAQTSAFHELMRSKRNFIIPATIFFMAFYFGLPTLAAFTDLLDVQVIGVLSLAYIYAFAQFAMTWILCHLYLSRANRWDDIVERIKRETARKGAESQ